MPEVGVEPTRPCGHGILSPARLPVSPLRHEEGTPSIPRPQRPFFASAATLPTSATTDFSIFSSADATGADRWKVYGTSGGLVGDGVQFQCKYFDPAELPERTVQETPPLDRTYNSETIPWREESLSLTEAEVARPLPLDYYTDLHMAICNGNPPPISTAHALAIMRLMDRVWETAI